MSAPAAKKAKKDVASMNAHEKYFHNMDIVQAKNKDILGPTIIHGLNLPNEDSDEDMCSLHKKEVID